MPKNYLLEDGRFAFRVKRHLREFLNAKDNRNDYINELIEKDALNDPLFRKLNSD